MKRFFSAGLLLGALAVGAFTIGASSTWMVSQAAISPHTQIMNLGGHHMAADADIGDGTSPNRKG